MRKRKLKIALLGYGKMGKAIESLAVKRNHEIALKIDVDNKDALTPAVLSKANVAIEFSTPGSAFQNVMRCIEADVPVVCGTTGWNEKLEGAKKYCMDKDGAFFYSANFSIGVNLFFQLNKRLASLMTGFPGYEPAIREIHHVHKLDAPSGTAIALASQIMNYNKKKIKWVNQHAEKKNELSIISERTGEVPGTHIITYSTEADEIQISHKANSRYGFALGTVLAAEWLIGKKGVFGMDDLLNFNSYKS